jgi:hypothetical protein
MPPLPRPLAPIAATLPVALEGVAERARDYIREARAANTRRG